MSAARPRPARRTHHTALLAITTTALTALLAACSSTSTTAPTAPTATSATSATSADPSASLEAEKAKVIAAYHAYQQALMRLFAGGKADPKILEGTATPEASRKVAQSAAVMFSAGDRMVGTLTSTPRSVQITGSTATLITCNDPSTWLGVKAGTTPIPGQTGRARTLTKVQLTRDAQANWLFQHTETVGKC